LERGSSTAFKNIYLCSVGYLPYHITGAAALQGWFTPEARPSHKKVI